jgi:hypothetical protein
MDGMVCNILFLEFYAQRCRGRTVYFTMHSYLALMLLILLMLNRFQTMMCMLHLWGTKVRTKQSNYSNYACRISLNTTQNYKSALSNKPSVFNLINESSYNNAVSCSSIKFRLFVWNGLNFIIEIMKFNPFHGGNLTWIQQ